MTRVWLGLSIVLTWVALAATGVFVLTPFEVTTQEAQIERELERDQRVVTEAGIKLATRLLDRTTDTATALGLGPLLDRLSPPAAAPGDNRRKRPATSAAAAADSEQAVTLIAELEQQLHDTLNEPDWHSALVDRKGVVVLAVGSALQLGNDLRNLPLVQDALYGLARVGVEALAHRAMLVTIAPTVGADGHSNGALLVLRPLSSLCQELLADTAVAGLALGEHCAAGAMTDSRPNAGLGVIAAPVARAPFFVDAARMGFSVLTRQLGPPFGHFGSAPSLSVASDQRAAWAALAARQIRIAVVLLAALLPVILLVVAASVIAARPAHTIANHLALVHQGGKVLPLYEHDFSGGFKRIVKNLNALVEKQARAAPSAQPLPPISALLPPDEEPELRFEPAGGGTIQPPKPGERTVQRQVDPAQLQALREAAAAKQPTLQPLIQPPVQQPPIVLAQPPVQPPVQAPSQEPPPAIDLGDPRAIVPTPPSALNSLFDADDEDAMGLPPLPEITARPRSAAALMSPESGAFSESEADMALRSLNIGSNEASPAADDTPWGSEQMTAPSPPPAMVVDEPPPTEADADEAHFREVFEQFIQLRSECGEPVDNLTFEKFVDKLRKSREQVIQKQGVSSVRFTVYIKDGKAALKAVAARSA